MWQQVKGVQTCALPIFKKKIQEMGFDIKKKVFKKFFFFTKKKRKLKHMPRKHTFQHLSTKNQDS